jgi:hypothetical protein
LFDSILSLVVDCNNNYLVKYVTVCNSWFHAVSESGYVISLWIRYLMATALCSGGWHDELCMMWLVAVGFWYMLYSKAESVLWIVISRKLMWLLWSFSKVKWSFGWTLLKLKFCLYRCYSYFILLKCHLCSYNILLCDLYAAMFLFYYALYSNPSVYEQSAYEFWLARDAQINTCFSIYKQIFACMSSFLSQTDHCSCREVMGN